MAINRELSQFGRLVEITDGSHIGIGTTANVSVGFGTITATTITANAFYGDGSNLTGVGGFSGDYNDLTNKPTIPTNNNQLTNGAGYITGYTVTQSDVTQHQAALSITESQISDLGTYLTSGDLSSYATQSYVGLATVGLSTFSGDYNDLTNKPTIPTNNNQLTNGAGYITSSDLSSYATTSYVDTEVAGLVDSAPVTLNTLNELAAALGDDANFSTTVTNSIAAKLPLSGGQMTGNITMSGAQTVDGRDLSVDGAKLDGIESGATADQTASEILTAIKTVDGSGSGLDADTVDGIQSTGIVYGTAGAAVNALSATQNVYELGQYKAGFWDVNGASWTPNTGWWWGATFAHRSNTGSYNYSGQLAFQNGNGGNGLYARTISNGTASSWSKLWSDGNDGSGSGLDADTLDGQQGSYYLDYNNFTNTPAVGGSPGGSNTQIQYNSSGSFAGSANLTFDGSSLKVNTGNSEQVLRRWTSSDTDIDGLLSGSNFGTIHEGAHNGHHVIGLRDNDSNDSFAIISGSGNYQTDTTYDKVVARFYVGGNVEIDNNLTCGGQVSATDFNSTSDINLKKNIEKIESPLDKLSELSGVTFQWIENDKQSGGVIAQDVEKVMPELVGQIEDHKSVNYNGLIGLLIECVKEQQKQIDELKNRA